MEETDSDRQEDGRTDGLTSKTNNVVYTYGRPLNNICTDSEQLL